LIESKFNKAHMEPKVLANFVWFLQVRQLRMPIIILMGNSVLVCHWQNWLAILFVSNKKFALSFNRGYDEHS